MSQNRKPKGKKKSMKATPSLVAQAYATALSCNPHSEYTQRKGGTEELVVYPKNDFCEKITVETIPTQKVGEKIISMTVVSGGDKEIILGFNSDSGRLDTAALAIIKAKIKSYC